MERDTLSVVTKAPVRFDIAGGYSDVAPFCDIEGGEVVNMAMAKFAHVRICTHAEPFIILEAKDLNEKEILPLDVTIDLSGPLRLIKAALVYLKVSEPLKIETEVEVPLGSGLGASASLGVALIGALRAYLGKDMGKQKIAMDALYLENVLLKNIGGGQDQYAATYGGGNFLKIGNGKVFRRNITISPEVINEIERKSILCFSGKSRLSGSVLAEIMEKYKRGDESTVQSLKNLRSLASKAEHALLAGRAESLGQILNAVYENQKKLHKNVITPEISAIFEIAQQFNVNGGKISGAGGGGMVFLYCPEKNVNALRQQLDRSGFLTFPFHYSKHGLDIRYY